MQQLRSYHFPPHLETRTWWELGLCSLHNLQPIQSFHFASHLQKNKLMGRVSISVPWKAVSSLDALFVGLNATIFSALRKSTGVHSLNTVHFLHLTHRSVKKCKFAYWSVNSKCQDFACFCSNIFPSPCIEHNKWIDLLTELRSDILHTMCYRGFVFLMKWLKSKLFLHKWIINCWIWSSIWYDNSNWPQRFMGCPGLYSRII